MPSHVIITEEERELFEEGGGNVQRTKYQKKRAYINFAQYSLGRLDHPDAQSVDIDILKTAMAGWLESDDVDNGQISKFFIEYFQSMRVDVKQIKPDNSVEIVQKRPKKKTAEAAKSHIKVVLQKEHKIDLADVGRFPDESQHWTSFLQVLKMEGRSDTDHTKELPTQVLEKSTDLFANAMNALKTRGTDAYFEYIAKIPFTHRFKLNYIIEWGMIYILESYDVRRGVERIDQITLENFTQVEDDQHDFKYWKKVVGEMSKNHQTDDENIEDSGVIPYLNLTESFNPGLFMEDYLKFLPPGSKHLIPQPRQQSGKFHIEDPKEMVLFEANKKVGQKIVENMMPVVSVLVGGPRSTNHQIRATSIKALRRAGFSWPTIAKLTGHKNLMSMIANYDPSLDCSDKANMAVAIGTAPLLKKGRKFEGINLKRKSNDETTIFNTPSQMIENTRGSKENQNDASEQIDVTIEEKDEQFGRRSIKTTRDEKDPKTIEISEEKDEQTNRTNVGNANFVEHDRLKRKVPRKNYAEDDVVIIVDNDEASHEASFSLLNDDDEITVKDVTKADTNSFVVKKSNIEERKNLRPYEPLKVRLDRLAKNRRIYYEKLEKENLMMSPNKEKKWENWKVDIVNEALADPRSSKDDVAFGNAILQNNALQPCNKTLNSKEKKTVLKDLSNHFNGNGALSSIAAETKTSDSPTQMNQFSRQINPHLMQMNPQFTGQVGLQLATQMNPLMAAQMNPQLAVQKNTQQAMQMNPQFAGQMNPQQAMQINPQFAGQMNPQQAMQINPQFAGQMNPQQAMQMNPQFAMQMNPQQAVQMNPQQAMQMNPQQAMQMNPQFAVQMNPQQAMQMNQQFAMQINPQQAVQMNPQQAMQMNPQFAGQMNSQLLGQINPLCIPMNQQSAGQMNPQLTGQMVQQFTGQMNPQFPGQMNPQFMGQMSPQFGGQMANQFVMQQPVSAGQIQPQFSLQPGSSLKMSMSRTTPYEMHSATLAVGTGPEGGKNQ